MEVVRVPLEDPVFFQMYYDIEVTGGAAVDAGLAFAREADAVALVHARRNLDRERLVLLDPARAAARAARVHDHLAAAVARGAGLLDREEALRQPHAARAVARLAGLRMRAGLGARAVARFARLNGRDADLGLGA